MSPFSPIPQREWLAANDLAFAIQDKYPVCPGHTLIIPRREVATWWEATADEQAALLDLVAVVRQQLIDRFHPDGFNIGFNDGAAAGQTVTHLHLHVIPRYHGDVPDPRGGIRHVIPGMGNYVDPSAPPYFGQPTLSTPYSTAFREQLLACLRDPDLDRIDLLVSFVMMSGLELIKERLDEAVRRGAHVRVLTTDYMLVTDASALGHLRDRLALDNVEGSLQARVFATQSTSFHPKAYLFSSSRSGNGVAFVGSSNLSRSALTSGVEWNVRHHNIGELLDEFERLWSDHRSIPLTQEFIDDYRKRKDALADRRIQPIGEPVSIEDVETAPAPWGVQLDALQALQATRIAGFQRGLVVMATGLGKTWLAAFDSSHPKFTRVLFVAHREEILEQARDTFRRVKPGDTFSFFVGGKRDASGDVVFASVQSLQGHLETLDRNHFDYIVVDEFHHASAPTYRKVIDYFQPTFLLGLTATPDRSDAADLLALCDDNLVYQCDLLEGIRAELLSPFKYRAIRDVADYAQIPWRNGRFDVEMLTKQLETQQRSQQVFDEWQVIGGATKRAIAFCCSITHADHMAAFFVARGVRAVAVHSGPTSAERAKSLDELEAKHVDVIFTVDLFNEGVDVPNIDLVMMLRPTESGIVFLQQLGRGLRRAEGKTHLDVIDFVGNHRSSLLKARLLLQLAGRGNVPDRKAPGILKEPLTVLPAGCSIVVDVEVIQILDELLGAPKKADLYADGVEEWMAGHFGARPTALEFAIRLGRHIELKKVGGWFGFLKANGWLSEEEQAVLAEAADFLLAIEHDAYTKSYKLLTMQAIQALGSITASAPLIEIAANCRWRIFSDPRLMSDLKDANSAFVDKWNPTRNEWMAYWRSNPINALIGGNKQGETAWFSVEDQSLQCTVSMADELVPTFDAMVAEILEYRLHRYLVGKKMASESIKRQPLDDDGAQLDATFHVESVAGRPTAILFDSAGGKKGEPGARNVDYVAGFDLLLKRLQSTTAVVVDAFVDSTVVQKMPIADRRLSAGLIGYPIALEAIDDVTALRKAFLKSMTKVGQAPGAKGGGNPRKAVRLVLSDLPTMAPERLADLLAGISAAPSSDTALSS